MATVTLTPGTVTHVLADKFYGLNFAPFFRQDMLNTQWRALTSALQMEILRAHQWNWDANYPGWDDIRVGVPLLSPSPVVQLQINPAPEVLPATKAPNDLTNFHTGARGATAFADLYAEYIAAGIVVPWVEMGNEPSNLFTTTGTNGMGATAHYSAVSGYANGAGEQTVRRHAETWNIVHMRRWADAIRARAATLGKAVKISGFSWGNSQGLFDRNSMLKWLDGTPLPNGQSNPNTVDSNMAWLDQLVDHPYAGLAGTGETTQAALNGIVYLPFTEGKTNLSGFYEEMRSALDARGGSAKTVAWNEGSSIGSDARISALADIATAIVGAAQQKRWNLDMCVYHSVNRIGTGDTGNPGLYRVDGSGTFVPTTRYYSQRDIISPFLRLYKRQIIASAATAPIATGSGFTPATSNANSVGRILRAAGVNADGSKIGVLLVNLDLSTGESVTVNFGATATTDATLVRLPSTAGQTSQMVAGTISGTSGQTSTTVTLGPGEGLLVEVPITGGGGTPPTLPKINTVADQLVAETIDGAVWTTFFGKPGYTIQPTVTGLVVTSSVEPAGWAELQSLADYDGVAARCSLNLADDGDQTLTSFEPYLQLHQDGTNYVGISVRGDVLRAYKTIAGSRTDLATLAWDPAAMGFLSIREAGGSTFWEYGRDSDNDGVVEWTTLHSVASPITMTVLEIRFGVTANAQTSSAKWRWLNFVPAGGAPPPGPATRVTTLTRSTAIARVVNPAARVAGLGGGGI